MRKLVLLMLLVSTFGYSQEKITEKLGDFNEVKVFNGLKVTLSESADPRIEIIGNKADDVVFKNVNGKLKLSLKFPETFNADDVAIKLFYNTDLTIIDANEGSRINALNTMKSHFLEVRVQEGATIELDLDVRYLTCKSVTGGTIRLTGKTVNQNVEVTTGGIYKAQELKSEQATITSASGGFAKIHVTEMLDARVRFGGSIFYSGNPEDIVTKKLIGGEIKAIH